MAYVEIWKSGRLITRRRVDEEKARKGCRIRLGSAGEVHLSIGGSKILGEFEVRMFEGEPPTGQQDHGQSESIPQSDHRVRTPLDFSVGAPSYGIKKTDHPPDIEGYQIIERLGEGGMGAVWQAEQLSTKRQVALKMMSSSRFASEKAQTRFEREVELTARLDHPNITRIFDSGLHHGIYYYAMEFVDGLPLDQYVVKKALTRNQILVLMRTVCEAIEHAHLRGVMHRDLKPSNIMVSFDAQPHVVDFGLARTFLEEDSEALTISVEGEVAGTPAYMSPEQAAGHHDQVDTRTDVYSLGVILYRLLTGQSPYDLSGSLFDVLQRVVQGKIRRPRDICQSIDRELEAVLLKAIAHNQEERYSSAGALAEDIDNYLNNEPLDARLPTTFYFLRKKAGKYRVQVGIALAVLIMVFGIALLAYAKLIGEQTRRQVAEEQAETHAKELDLKSEKLTWAELRIKILGDDKQEAEAALNLLQEAYTAAQDEVSQLNHKLGERKPSVAVRRIDLKPGGPLSSITLVRKPSLPWGIKSWTLETCGHRGRITKLVYSPDGNLLASTGQDDTLRLWDVKSGRLIKILINPNTIANLTWLEGGDRVNRFSWSTDETTYTLNEIMALWEVDLPKIWQPLQQTIVAVALSPNRDILAIGDRDGTIRFMNLRSGQTKYIHMAAWCGSIQSVRFSPDGKRLATCAGLGTICLWDAHRWEPLSKFETDGITGGLASVVSSFDWAPDGASIVRVNNKQHLIEILDSQSGELMRTLSVDTHDIISVSWSPDGAFIAATTKEGPVHLWDVGLQSRESFATLSAHSGHVNALTWLTDHNLITIGEDGKINIWEPGSTTPIKSIQGSIGPITCLALSPENKILAAGSNDGIIRLWTVGRNWTSTILISDPNNIEGRESIFKSIAWSSNSTLLASGDSNGEIKIWDSRSRRSIRSFISNCQSISSLVWSPDGRMLLCGGADGIVQIWDAMNDFEEHVVLLPLWGQIGPGLAFSAAGDYRGPLGIANHVVYVVETTEACMTLNPADFKSRYGWVNEPWQVGLYKPGAEKVERFYVNADSGGPYDGKTWATAFSDLQDALSIAQPNTEIWVAAGTYNPDRGTGDRKASFHLKNGVRLLGGFSGTEVSTYQRDPNNNETILSGDLKGDDGSDFYNNDENSYRVVTSYKAEPNAVLDGFIITAGNANGPKGPQSPGVHECNQRCGGGMFNFGNPNLLNCVFRYNYAMECGGGMLNGFASKPKLTNCMFMDNSAREGGGMFNDHRSNPTMTDCKFIGNRTITKKTVGIENGLGGGMYNRGSNSTLFNCIFIENTADTGGGIYGDNSLSARLVDCRFIGNSANTGGGITNDQSSKSELINCFFVSNKANHRGGGVYNFRLSRPILINCGFWGNKAVLGGGLANDGDSMAHLYNCIFSGNLAEKGGGLLNGGPWKHPDRNISSYADSKLVNCTFSRNRATEYGGGIWDAEESCPVLINCILWDNKDSSGIDESAQIYNAKDKQTLEINYSCIMGWNGKLGGKGNFGDDPLFIDPNGLDGQIGTEDDNLRLKVGSPCINRGNNKSIPIGIIDIDNDADANEPMPSDFEGRPRIFNGTVDIGAYESG